MCLAVIMLAQGAISAERDAERDAESAVEGSANAVWIDVRSESEYKAEHLDRTEFIPHTEIGEQIGKLNLAKDTPIKLFCRSGHRAGIAEKTLEQLGYTNVENVGGIADVKKLMATE